jgi:diguanylate cyclase (GGDEF)-like protein
MLKPPKSRPSVLIVDDVPANIKMLREVLKDDYDIRFAKSGKAALDLLKTSDLPDLILLDIMMPEMDGYDACQQLKADPATQSIPVIFITSRDDEADEVKGFDMGAVDYITKPFSIPVVRARVQTHVELKRQREILENLSSVDGLTGISNRRQFNEFMNRHWRIAMRISESVSLIMIDIDFFKLYNDTYGHLEGDECLKQIAMVLTRCVTRSTDLVARFGGEEFACVMPFTDLDGALSVADAMRSAIEELNITHEKSPIGGRVTASLGLAAMVPIANTGPDLLIQKADRALYAAKAEGRNRVQKG